MSTLTSSNVITSIGYCRNFPNQPENKIGRENLYEVVESHFLQTNIVCIEGDSLTGKSEFLAEYMRKNSDSTIGVFLSADSGFFYSAEFVRLTLGEQIFHLTQGVPQESDSISNNQFNRLLFQLQKFGRRKKVTIVIDGLAKGGGIDSRRTQEIMDLLPFGQKEFQFLISGNCQLLQSLKLDSKKSRTVSLIPISYDEAKTYLSDLKIDDQDVLTVRKFCGGVIGQIQKIRSFIKDGILISELLAGKKGTLDTIFDFEWNLTPLTEKLKSVIATIVFSPRLIDANVISDITNIDIGEVQQLISDCKILEKDSDNTFVTVRSEAQKKFIAAKLIDMKQQVHERFINFLLESPRSKDATLYLPTHLVTANKHQEVINHLDSDHFVRLLNTEKSLGALKKHAEIGLNAARVTNNDAAEVRFALINSTLTGLTFSSGMQEEVQTLFKLGMQEQATELAFLIPTSEERLKLLASIGKSYAKNKLPIPDNLRDNIKSTILNQDCQLIGPLAIEVACDLTAFDLKLAITVFQKALEYSPDTISENQKSLGAMGDTKDINPREIHDDIDNRKIVTKLSASDIMRFSNAVAKIFASKSSDDLLRFVGSIDEQSRLYIYKRWLEKHKSDINAWIIAEKALDLAINNLDQAPKIRDLREIAIVLPEMPDTLQLEKLITRLQTQKGMLRLHGTSEESIQLEMLLFIGKLRLNQPDVKLDLMDLYIEISEIEEIGIKATCLAWMLNYLKRIPNSVELDNETNLISEIKDKLIQVINELLELTADHYVIAKNAIISLSKADPTLAIQLVKKLNTQTRRDQGFSDLAQNLIRSRNFDRDSDVLIESIKLIEDEDDRQQIILYCLDSLEKASEQTVDFRCDHRFLELWEQLRLAQYKLKGAVYTYKIKQHLKICDEKLPTNFSSLWDDITTGWVKTDIGYWVANQMASIDKAQAEVWMTNVRQEVEKSKSPSQSINSTLTNSLLLAIRSFVAITPDRFDKNINSFQRLAKLIGSVSSLEIQVLLWVDLGVKLHFDGQSEFSKLIVSDYIKPLIDLKYPNNEFLTEILIIRAAPLLYFTHPASFENYIGKIKFIHLKDYARLTTCRTILRKMSPYDNYKLPAHAEYQLNPEECADILSILKDISTDSYISEVIEDLSSSLAAKKNTGNIRRNAALDFLDRLIQIADSKLPDINNIIHDGYKIVSHAYIYCAKYQIDKSTVKAQDWDELASQAKSIKNVSDRSVVMAIVGTCSKNKGVFANNAWVDDLHQEISTIPSIHDRIERFAWVAKIIEPQNKVECKKLLSDAMRLSNEIDDEVDAESKRRRILDYAHNVDPKLADILIDLLDTDKAKAPSKRSLVERVSFLEKGNEVAANPLSIDLAESNYEQIAEISQKNLAALNAGRIALRPLSDFKKLAQVAADMPIKEAFHVWSYILQNQIKKTDSAHLVKNIQPVFDSICLTAELILALVGKASSDKHEYSYSSDAILGPGDRVKVLEKIKNWIELQEGKLIRISDPYFGPEELELIYLVSNVLPNAKVAVLTSKEHIKKKCTGMPDESFHESWNAICDTPPPDTDIHIIGFGSYGKHPIHDRWLITDDSGLRLGSSVNSIGYLRISEISEMSASLIEAALTNFDELVHKPPRTWGGERLTLSSFKL